MSPGQNTKLLSAFGANRRDIEIVDLSTGTTCSLPTFLDEDESGSTGGTGFYNTYDKVVSLCPHNYIPNLGTKCWDLDPLVNLWTEGVNMLDSTKYAVEVDLGNGDIWMGGGEDYEYYWMDSEEFDASVGEFIRSIRLPQAKKEACAVNLGEGKVFLVGGAPASRRSWILDTNTGDVTDQVSFTSSFPR